MKFEKIKDDNSIFWFHSSSKSLFIFLILFSSNLSFLNSEQQNALKNELFKKSENQTSTTAATSSLSKLNEEHANMYSQWLDTISSHLYSLTLEYSGFNMINETYNIDLLQVHHADFKEINFGEMIVNISNNISEFLATKTNIVESLSDEVEKLYNNYYDDMIGADDEYKYKESLYQYYNSKEKSIFCDDEIYRVDEESRKNENLIDQYNKSLLMLNNVTAEPLAKLNETNEEKVKTRNKKSTDEKNVLPDSHYHHHKHAPHRHHNSLKNHEIDNQYVVQKSNLDNFAQIQFNKPHYYEKSTLDDDVDRPFSDEMSKFKVPRTNLTCLNRSVEEYFPQHLKVNRNNSTLHIPVNVFNRDQKILHTARWSETLDEFFKGNLEKDRELFWQYFCSAHGLFRRYPGAFWDTPSDKDFFDCRLQHWYISAAASAKDVIILLDTSGSMTGLRLEIAKKLIESLMDTFTDNDFFNILTFSSGVQYLMNLPNETHYCNRLVQAGYRNKLTYLEKLKYFRNTSNMAAFQEAYIKAFELLLSNTSENSGCNKIIMVITDGTQEKPEKVFQDFNHIPDNQVRIFTFMIGRDMTDTYTVKWMGCSNHGDFYHVATLADVNEHVHEYIPVLSRPSALKNVRESTWSNVFIGHVDKELKIAVARPAFKNFTKIEITRKYSDKGELIGEREELLLGVVGTDVPVLTLISNVSPKFQMGVGIYIIMLDNNGYIVFHPSIREEMKKSENDYKGRSHSVELKSFEIPIENEDEFEELEHRMIDQKTDNQTLKNFKREGIRVVKRETEYVYTNVNGTSFSVAIASPKSFGRYYVDIDHTENENYNTKLQSLIANKTLERTKTRVQLYNCSYDYVELIKNVLDNSYHDFCLNYASNDPGQVVAIKADLLMHHKIYDHFDFSLYTSNKNLIRSYFYGTYSGMTFYLPVTFFRNVTKIFTNETQSENLMNKSLNNLNNIESNSRPPRKNSNKGAPQTSTTTKPKILTYDVEESYVESPNMFTIEENKHTFSFEKQYYTRSIEFSDFMRTEFNDTEPLVIYFLNESSRDTKRDTIGATLSIWLKKVPTAVSGVVYDSKRLQNIIFEEKMKCSSGFCQNICGKNRSMNVTCYLIDEHGVVILSTNEKPIVGLPLYESNPWLMKDLEKSGIYNLVIPGSKLNECRKPERTNSSATIFKGLISIFLSTVSFLINLLSTFFSKLIMLLFITFKNKDVLIDNIINHGISIVEPRISIPKIDNINADLIKENKNCYFFGIYSLNIEKAKHLNASEFRTWCKPKRYLVGYIKHSNLIMVIAEHEPDLSKCKNLTVNEIQTEKIKTWQTNENQTNSTENVDDKKLIASLNRYRKKPTHCRNKFKNESGMFPYLHRT